MIRKIKDIIVLPSPSPNVYQADIRLKLIVNPLRNIESKVRKRVRKEALDELKNDYFNIKHQIFLISNHLPASVE